MFLIRAARHLLPFLVRVTFVIFAMCAVTYGLSLTALYDLERAGKSTVAPSVVGDVAVFANGDGITEFRRQGRSAVPLGGHNVPLVSAHILSDGKTILTTAYDGTVRLSKLASLETTQAATAPGLRRAIRERLWEPYGTPVAQHALWATAQVLPLHIPETAQGRRGRVFKDCDLCPEMVEIEPGSMLMGSPLMEAERYQNESWRHLVSVTQPFAVGRYPVTFAEWDACVADGGCGGYKPDDEGWGRGDRPVINVSWDDAKAYAAWLSKRSGKSYRLLSEAEREYVTRAGTTAPFWWGSTITPDQANYDGTYVYAGGGEKGEYREKTMPVKSFRPNAWGLYQVHGNVWDWVEDCYHDSYDDAPTDGSAGATGDCRRRVLRGGSWSGNPRYLRSATRIWLTTDYRFGSVGFRLARTLPH